MKDDRRREEDPHARQQRERIGVAGDPTPDHEYGDTDRPPGADVAPDEAGTGVSPSVRGSARRLADPALLTDRQALAYVLREVEGVGRDEAAEQLGISVSTLDGLLGKARRKLRNARKTLELVDDLEGDE